MKFVLFLLPLLLAHGQNVLNRHQLQALNIVVNATGESGPRIVFFFFFFLMCCRL